MNGEDPQSLLREADRLLHEYTHLRVGSRSHRSLQSHFSPSDEDDASTRRRILTAYKEASDAGIVDAARKTALCLWSWGRRRNAVRTMREVAAVHGDVEAVRLAAQWLWEMGEPRAGGTARVKIEGTPMREEEGSEGSEDSRDGDADRRTRRAVSSRRQAFRLWKDAADRVRDVHCMRKVAECYLSGEGCRQANQAKAMRYLEKAADKGDRGAIMMLVRLYHEQAMDSLNGQEKRSSMKIEESARGIAKTEKIKTETQHREEDADDSPTSDEDDDETESQPETAHTRLYRYVRMGASDGDAMCISKLAYAQRHGLDGIEKNVPAALELYLEAASRGDVESRAAAADVFYHGEQGVPRDRARAFAMFAQCAREGWAPSFRALADCYRTGAGAPNDKPDLPLAHMYYTEAASLTPDATSLRILGDMHTTGLGCAKNLPLAFDLYDRAWSICSSSSDDADLEAGRCLARCYWFGRGVEKDRERAKEVWAALLSRAKGSMEREDVRRLEGMDDAGFEEILAVVNE